MRPVVLVVLCSLAAAPLLAQDAASGNGGTAAELFQSRSTFIGLKAGFWTGATVYVEDGISTSADLSGGLSVGGFLDYSLSPKLTGGLLADWTDFDGDALYDLSLTAKALVGGQRGKIGYRPGIGIGVAKYASDNTQLTLRGGLEMVGRVGMKSAWVAEAMLYGSPTGGSSDFWVTWSPGLLLRGGYIF